MKILIPLILIAGLLSGAVVANEATPMAEDPVLEKRVMALSKELRCLVCQNQSVAASHAELAIDMRNEVRDKMKSGWSDQQIVDYLVERYGDFVRYRPPFNSTTMLLWLGPLGMLLIGATVLFVVLKRRRARGTETVLTKEERERVDQLLNEDIGRDKA
ncbi:MAG: cytochrome c-type biogenesis protein CcmH [Gammaproteobacteria bacterium]|nr:cytochrome c-type biogenesis protein CcmH [Gammaproteobacteria bacterium]